MTEPLGSVVNRVINSDFVERITMSFSLYAMVAQPSKKQNSQPQNWLRLGADASAIHGRLGCSGCTPAEPYPPNREKQAYTTSAVEPFLKEMGATFFIQNNDLAKNQKIPFYP